MNDVIYNRIKKCIDKVLEHEISSIRGDMSLMDDLGMESLQLVTLQVELEDEFEIEFDPLEDDFYEIFQTVDTIYYTIERKLS